ncbi:hypothetical protein NM688_g4908 [Phlebia brevispora]|uniref:Uncharacterized protein n=1 Tax=Phlebia brevispora TaxID=194682 RepID=A0ACC1T1B7_9APHY|nr:hypothetical protein NM688_g4908 [Phlebia brevispora]
MRTFSYTLWVCTVLDIVVGHTLDASIDIIPSTPSTTPSVAEYISQSSLFDGPYVAGLNDTTSDWWYFDAISSDLNYTLVVTFFAATPDGLWPTTPDLGSATYLLLFLTLPDGTLLEGAAIGEELAIVTVEDGSSGVLGNTSNFWVGSPDMTSYEVSLNVPDIGLTGNISLQSTAPAHFPCTHATAAPGQRLNLVSEPTNLGWVNAIPDANATVSLDVNGTTVQFSGFGYHDQNWASQPVHSTANAWYWGHARLGPFSVVWFDIVSSDGTELVSSYLARDNQIISSTCGNATVRPVDGSAPFPPTPSSSVSEPPGFNITADIEGEGTLIMQIASNQVVLAVPGMVWRWTGEASGGFGNGTTWQGVAFYEQFTFDNS